MSVELYTQRFNELKALTKGSPKIQIGNEWVRGNAALLLLNQVNYDEIEKKIPKFIKSLFPSIVHTLAAIPSIIGIQTCKGEVDQCLYFKQAGNSKSITSISYNTTPHKNIKIMNPGYLNSKDIAYQSIEVAATMADNTTRLILEDIMDNAEHRIETELNSVEGVINDIKRVSDTIKNSIGCPANFTIMPVNLAHYIKNELVTEYDFESLPINIKRIGCLRNKWLVYINGYEGNRVIVGYRGLHPVDAGYFFCPFIQFYDPIEEEKKKRFDISSKSKHQMIRPDYFACMEFMADNRSTSMEEFL